MTSRKVFNSTTAWAFGFSVTIFMIALWGRAVVVDSDTLGESLQPLSGSSMVVDLFGDWMAGELVQSGYEAEVVDPAVDLIFESSATAGALDGLVQEVVDAAASTDPAGSHVDVASLLGPTVPEVTAGLNQLGFPAEQGAVASTIAGLDPLVVREPGSSALVGPASPAAARLGTAAVLALVGMVVFGYFAVVSSEDRVAAVRSLFTRVAVGGLGFSILLLIGSWITDPSGGRAPVAETASAIAASKWVYPLQVGLVAAAIAFSIYLLRRWLRREEGPRSGDGRPRPQRARSLSRSGSR